MDPTIYFARDDEPSKPTPFLYQDGLPSNVKVFYTDNRFTRLVKEREIPNDKLIEGVVNPFFRMNQVFILDKGGLIMANIDALQSSVRGDASWSIDQMAPFDAVILCTNEMGESGLQVIFDITLTHWGTTYSIEECIAKFEEI